MKKLILSIGLLMGMATVSAQTLEQTMYVDFGPNSGTNGAITPNPDINNNYWNNPTNGAAGSVYDIVNNQNADTGINMEVTDSFVVNTGVNYGPTAPTAALLNDFAIGTATQDYFYLETGGSGNSTGQLTFSNLTTGHGYSFYIFASRPTSSVRNSGYTVAGLTSFTGQVQTSDGSTGNLNTVLETGIIIPDANGEITIDVSVISGGYAYINALKVQDYSNLPVVDVASISVSGNDITVSGATSQLTAQVLPVNATLTDVVWSVDNTAVAIIDENGLLMPTGNGTVTVTATSAQNAEISDSITITVSNQVSALYFSGSATENGNTVATALPMHMVNGLSGTITSTFEIYTSLTEAGTFNFYSSQDSGATIYGENGPAGVVAAGGNAIDPSVSGPVWITVNVATGAYTITPINWSVVGSSIAGGWGGDEPLAYQGNGVWQAEVDMTVVGTDTNPRFVFKANQDWGLAFKKVAGTEHTVMKESVANQYGVALQDIDLKYGNFIITLDLSNYTYGIQCVAIDENEISFMGSSVMNGQGATDMHGYAYQYNELLAERATEGSPDFYRSNISVNGNNTTAALNRFEKDVIGDCSTYVIFGLALGNEGIHETGQVAFDSYNANMQLLIQKAIDAGKTPLVVNNYVRGDYNATDYNFVKQMNIMMAQWDVPSINVLGATDNGTGNWVEGYWWDALHPNDAGHTEMFYTFVPSLFDAIAAGKPQPVYSANTYVTPNPAGSGALTFTPDNIVHSFTVSFDVQTSGNGQLLSFTTSGNNNGTVGIDENGHVVYTSPSGTIVTGTTVITDGSWHKVTLTHYYAWGHTELYTDATAEGAVAEQLAPQMYALHGNAAPADVNYRNWFFYRSGMNDMEISAMNDGAMLKSSLELYAPLNGEAGSPEMMFENKAQSTNTIDSSNFATLGTNNVIDFGSMKAYPNPVKDVLTISTDNNITINRIEVYNTLGMMVEKAEGVASINLGNLQQGIYMVKVKAGATTSTIKVIKE